MKASIRKNRALNIIFALLLLVSVISPLFNPQTAGAISGSDWKSGRIIDDAIFYNKSSMTAAQIQQFFDAKVPVCERSRASSNPSYQPPWTCLKEYLENTTTKENNIGRFNPDGSPYQVPGGKSAAQIIWDVAQEQGINPQVLIVMLQKEQGLVTDTWPWQVQYQKAMGYACPDTAPCDTQYYGFYNQVSSAAWQLKRYIAYPNSYNFKAGVMRYIQYSPNATCGGSQVFLENAATAALYNYTPYQPNAGALANLYGSSDCGAYGNRNFWRYFNDWFGPTWVTNLPGCSEATNTNVACVWRVKDPVTQKSTLTTSINERDIKFVAGSSYEGVVFFGNVSWSPNPWNIPIYRLTKPDGGQLLTASLTEKNTLVGASFKYEGIEFYADPPAVNSGYPVYRMYSNANNEHRYVMDLDERQLLINQGYIDEGVAFSALTPSNQAWAPPQDKDLVYRFGEMPGSRAHFWTTNLYEREDLIKRGYRYEGVAWESLKSNTGMPIYRLYSPTMLKHLYTTDENEKNILSKTGYWNYEGVGQYMSSTPNNKPVYRLYSPITHNHLWTTNVRERDDLVANGTFRYEGIAWYQP